LFVLGEGLMNLWLAPPTRKDHKRGSGGSKRSNQQSNKLNQVQKITVDQDSGDVKLWIDDSGISIGSINTDNSARVSASQSAAQKNS
jgi:hypothetical protein